MDAEMRTELPPRMSGAHRSLACFLSARARGCAIQLYEHEVRWQYRLSVHGAAYVRSRYDGPRSCKTPTPTVSPVYVLYICMPCLLVYRERCEEL